MFAQKNILLTSEQTNQNFILVQKDFTDYDKMNNPDSVFIINSNANRVIPNHYFDQFQHLISITILSPI
jgi:hypothetical protein